MFTGNKKTIVIIAIIVCKVAVLSAVLWIFFPSILRFFSPTRYVQYSLLQTGEVLSNEIAVINDFFDFPDLSDSDVKQLSVDFDNISLDLRYNVLTLASIDLSRLTLGLDMLYNRGEKQASIDLNTGWDGNVFPLTLYTDTNQVAIEFGDRVSFAVGTSTFGKELAGLGLPIDEDMELDLGFLFPDVINTETREEAGAIAEDFIMSLKFRRADDIGSFPEFDGVAMTTIIDGAELNAFLYELIDCIYGYSERATELKQAIGQTHAEDHELTVFICKAHIIRAVQSNIATGYDSNVYVTIHLAGEPSMLDHIIIDVEVINADGNRSYHINSKGQHVPVDDKFTTTTEINGFDIGTMYFSSEFNKSGTMYITLQTDSYTFLVDALVSTTDESIQALLNTIEIKAPIGSVRLSGDIDLYIAGTSSAVRDITDNAYSISDFDRLYLNSLFQIIWDIIRWDEDLLDMFGQQFLTFILNSVLDEQTSEYIIDQLGDSIVDVMDFLVRMLGTENGISIDSLLDVINDLIGSQIREWFLDNIEGVLDSIIGLIRP